MITQKGEFREKQLTTAAQYREAGKVLLKQDGKEEQSKGYDYLLKAFRENDAEAAYLVGVGILKKELRVNNNDNPVEFALGLIQNASYRGIASARSFLNRYCESRYKNHTFSANDKGTGLPLVGLDGNPFYINRQGVRTPIDAVLVFENSIPTLKLSADLSFLFFDEITDHERFERAVIQGIKDWAGDYSVFGGQPIKVTVDLTVGQKSFDTVLIAPVTDTLIKLSHIGKIGTKKMRQRAQSIVDDKRSFALTGLKWSITSRKFLYIQSENFEDYDEIRHVAKHEFGHALGLGDLYAEDGILEGVKKGSFSELDAYYIKDGNYNLVMCDHHGPISNNDIEMVLLAYHDNKMQLFQPQLHKKKISIALGKGD